MRYVGTIRTGARSKTHRGGPGRRAAWRLIGLAALAGAASTHSAAAAESEFATVAYDDTVASLVADVASVGLEDLVAGLTGEHPVLVDGEAYTILTRHTRSGEGIDKATQYVHDEMSTLGLDASYHDWQRCYSCRNVIAEQSGVLYPDEVVLVTAHLDSAPPSGSVPGADDNATGVATVMTAADLLSQYPFARTLRYAFFTGEEQGAVGSAEYAALAAQENHDIVAVYNVDMVGWDDLGDPVVRLHTRSPEAAGSAEDVAIANAFVDVVGAYGLGNLLSPVVTTDGQSRSDQASFWERGYPGILVIEDDIDDFNPYYHSADDTLANLNLAYFTSVARASVGTVAHLAELFVGPFYLALSSPAVEVCAGGRSSVELDVVANSSSVVPVALHPSGEPPGVTLLLSPGVVVPGATSTVRVDASGTAPGGTYLVDVTGDDGSSGHAVALEVEVVETAPGPITVLAPANQATGESRSPTFTWQSDAPEGTEYELEVATDAAFADVVYSVTVETRSHSIDGTMGRDDAASMRLGPDTTYYWRVSGSNVCGSGPVSATSTFTTGPAPRILFVDDAGKCPDVRQTYLDAMNGIAVRYDVWDTDASDTEPSFEVLQEYGAVVWFTGSLYASPAGPDAAGEAALSSYLDAGGNLFLLSAGYLNRTSGTFAADYLGVAGHSDYAQHEEATGIDPFDIGTHTLAYPERTDPWMSVALTPTANAAVALESMATMMMTGEPQLKTAGVAKQTANYRTSFWTAPLEALPTPQARAEALRTVLDWFIPLGELGDVNTDGMLDIVDALLVSQYYVGQDPQPFDPRLADTNCDGQVDIVDALLIAQRYVDLIPGFCGQAT